MRESPAPDGLHKYRCHESTGSFCSVLELTFPPPLADIRHKHTDIRWEVWPDSGSSVRVTPGRGWRHTSQSSGKLMWRCLISPISSRWFYWLHNFSRTSLESKKCGRAWCLLFPWQQLPTVEANGTALEIHVLGHYSKPGLLAFGGLEKKRKKVNDCITLLLHVLSCYIVLVS